MAKAAEHDPLNAVNGGENDGEERDSYIRAAARAESRAKDIQS